MKQTEFSQEEINQFMIDDRESIKAETSTLDKFIDDVLEVSHTPMTPHGLEKSRSRPRVPLILSIFLGAFFAGSLFGFFWGKNYEKAHAAQELTIRERKMLSLFEELKEIFNKKESEGSCIAPFPALNVKEPFSMRKLYYYHIT